MKRFALGLLCLALSANAKTTAKTKVIATFPIPDLVVQNADGSYGGHFMVLAQRMIAESGEDVKIVVYPPKRALEDFHAGRIDGFFPATSEMTSAPHAQTQPFARKRDFIFYRKGTPASTVDDLVGKRVGLTAGYPYKQALVGDKRIQWETGVSDEANLRKLVDRRIDFFLCEEFTARRAIKTTGVQGVEYDASRPVSTQDGHFYFQKNAEGERLARSFDKALEKVIKKKQWSTTAPPPSMK